MASCTTTDGFYRWSDIVWVWPGSCPKYDRNAIHALLHPNALDNPDHPLRERSKDGVEVFIGTLADGYKMLLFSLKQIEYCVEYIHYMRLTDLAWAHYYVASRDNPDGKVLPPPRGPISRLSLPNTFLPQELFVDIETVMVTTANVKKLDNRTRKLNKALKRKEATPGSATPLSELQGPTPTTETNATPDVDSAILHLNENTVDDVQAALDQQLDDATEGAAESPDPTVYFDLAQQAVFTASQGGTFKALQKKNPPGWNSTQLEEILTPAVGRGCFLSLEMRPRDDDPEQFVDVGYAAMWFSQNPNDDKYDLQQEAGHWVAEEERGGNGSTLSDYHFGVSLPCSRKRLSTMVNRKILELWQKAGKGAIYIVMHSPQSDYTRFGSLGVNVANWHTELDPVCWAMPGHATPEALGQRMLLDTAILWGAVEAGQPGDKTEMGVSARSVQDALRLLHLSEYANIDTDNSGNMAMMTFILFDKLINSSLRETRDMVYFSLVCETLEGVGTPEKPDNTTVAEPAATDADDDTDTEELGDGEPDDSEYDSDFDGVAAFYTDENGQLVAAVEDE